MKKKTGRPASTEALSAAFRPTTILNSGFVGSCLVAGHLVLVLCGRNAINRYGNQRSYRILADRHNLGKVDLESARSTTTDEAPLMKASGVRLLCS